MRHIAGDGSLIRILSSAIVVAALFAISMSRGELTAAAQMPDARQMSGVPLPVSDLPAGTVTVRVVRGVITNVIAGQLVELAGGPSQLSATTNEAGRAEFNGLVPGTRVKASATVDGERLESQEFSIPAAGGIRIALVATDSSSQKQGEPNRQPVQAAQPGAVVLGERSRFVFEMGDEALNAFALLDIVNAASVPVQPPQPLEFDLPAAAVGAGLLEGSSPQGTLAGKRIVVKGPFAPGSTLVQFGYSLPIDSGSLTFEQRLPVHLAQLSVMAQKVGAMQIQSAQITEHRDMPLQGETFIVGKGPAIQAGQTVAMTFSGLPHHAVWPRNVALALAALILGGGVWLSTRRRPDAVDQDRRQRLEAKRNRLFAELTAIEQQRAQAIDPQRYEATRGELVAALERLYAQLDDEAAA